MGKPATVSIVTPAYNQAAYLQETIESVLGQDYPALEYIVLDDGSIDSTPEILRRCDARVRWERHENMGQARTLNKGWQMSKGEFIGYLSSDDRLRPDAVSSLVKALQGNARSVVAYCDFDLIDGSGKKIRTVATEEFDRKRLTEDLICQPGPGALFRRTVLDAIGGWREDLRQVADFEFWLRAASLGDFVRVSNALAQFRIHDGSASFRAISPARSMEIVETMAAYWAGNRGSAARRSLARANIIASRSHAQSGRPVQSLQRLLTALRIHPASALQAKTWTPLVSGMLRRAYYKLVHRTGNAKITASRRAVHR